MILRLVAARDRGQPTIGYRPELGGNGSRPRARPGGSRQQPLRCVPLIRSLLAEHEVRQLLADRGVQPLPARQGGCPSHGAVLVIGS
jgi:hypothetical protein